MKICTIIGARPQFIKAAAVSAKIAELSEHSDISEVIIHTGQHYDSDMSNIFFEELKIPKEKYNLQVGSGRHGEQTAKMLTGIEDILINERPDWVLIYGDTNSTLAGALAAVKMHIPVVHIEAGMRSFNRNMPEEINRIVSDSISTLNLCSTQTAVDHLNSEGMGKTAFLTGDVMYDCALKFEALAEKYCDPLSKFSLSPKKYILMTCHRAENTDDKLRLSQIVSAVNTVAEKHTVLYTMHPRTASFLKKYDLNFSENVQVVDPVGYLDMLVLEKSAEMILTDSGGIQKEAFFYKVPCITMRDETEWVETVELGWNTLTGASYDKITAAVANFAETRPPETDASPYGDGNAAEIILQKLLES